MRLFRFLSICAGAALIAACSDSSPTGTTSRPPMAGVRFINALADTFAVDVRPQDQILWRVNVSELKYRGATEYMAVEAGTWPVRMFPQPGATAADPKVVSQVLLDESLTFEANVDYTVLVTGSARANTQKFVVIRDEPGDIPSGSIAVRAINASTGAVDFFITNTLDDALPGSPTFANVGSIGTSAYVTRAAGAAAARATAAGGSSVSASQAGPTAAKAPSTSPENTVFPAGGVDAGGSALSAVYFPASVPGSKAASFASPGIVWYLDKHPPHK